MYTSYADGNTYELVITKSSSRATFMPGAGDTYVLRITVTATGAIVETISGTVSSASGGTLTLKNGDTEFTVTISGGEMTAITVSGGGSIPGTTVAAPGAGMTAGGGNQGGGTNPGTNPGNTANPFVGTWGYSTQTRAQLAQELEVTEQILIEAGFPAVMSPSSFTFNANMSFVLSSWSWTRTPQEDITPVLRTYGTGTYTVSGNLAIMTFTSGDWAGYEWEAVISGNSLYLCAITLAKKSGNGTSANPLAETTWENGYMTIIFNANMTWVGESDTGTYTVSGNTVIIKEDDGQESTWMISGNTLFFGVDYDQPYIKQ